MWEHSRVSPPEQRDENAGGGKNVSVQLEKETKDHEDQDSEIRTKALRERRKEDKNL
jgi:hypothetical protein